MLLLVLLTLSEIRFTVYTNIQQSKNQLLTIDKYNNRGKNNHTF